MNHLTDDQLVLHYYGEAADSAVENIQQHLEICAGCRQRLTDLQRLLNSVNTWPVPERGPAYSAQVWERVAQRVQVSPRRQWEWLPRWITVGVLASLVVLAFMAGRWSGQRPGAAPTQAKQVRERILMVALGDHLERSQRVLVELSNSEPVDFPEQQKAAEDLLAANRLYRMAAVRGSEPGVASVLDDLERLLVDVSHAEPEEWEQLRQRMADQGILFKVRVVESNVRNWRKDLPQSRQF